MRHPSLLLALLCALVLLAGCAGTREVAERPDLPSAFPSHTLAQIRQNIVGGTDTLRAFEGKTSLSVDTPGRGGSFGATIRQRRGDSLYLSISPGLGIEAARALITPDSFFVYDRIKKRLYYGNLAYADQYLPLPLDGDDIFQSLLGILAPDDFTDWQIEADANYYYLRDPADTQLYVIDPAFWRVVRYEAFDGAGEMIEQRLFSEFDSMEGLFLPRRVVLRRPLDQTTASLYYRRLDLNPAELAFAFRISDDAERILVDEQQTH